jgi:single-strand DNA-binding protein
MAGEPYITVVGNLAGDPELRFTASGHAVANFTIAQTPRTFDKQSQQWVEDETLWVRASVWREAAENVAETLSKGARVIAYGRLKARSFETKTGEQRTNWELDVEEIGPSLRWATAQVNRTPKQGSSGFGAAPTGGTGWSAAPGGDPWGAGATSSQGDAPPPF